MIGAGKSGELSAGSAMIGAWDIKLCRDWLLGYLSLSVIGAGKPGELSAAAGGSHGGTECLAAGSRHRNQQGRELLIIPQGLQWPTIRMSLKGQ